MNRQRIVTEAAGGAAGQDLRKARRYEPGIFPASRWKTSAHDTSAQELRAGLAAAIFVQGIPEISVALGWWAT